MAAGALALPVAIKSTPEVLGMDALVLCWGDKLQVFKPVVLLVSVDVVDLHSVGDWSIGELPDNVVNKPLSGPIPSASCVGASVSLAGE